MEEKTSVRIVPATTEHLDALSDLERACFGAPWSRNLLASELENLLSAVLVALSESGEVIGCAILQVVLDEATLTRIAVRPDCRRQGIARRLMQVFLDFAKANRLAFITLEVRASNAEAIALYENCGFRAVGRRTNYYENPREDALIMTKEFSANGMEAADRGTTENGV